MIALVSALPLVTTVCGWIAVTIYAMALTNRRAFEGFHGRAVWRRQQFIVVFELLRIEFAPDVVEWFRQADASAAGDGRPGWLFALAELPLHPYVLVGCVAVMPFLSMRVIARERPARERAKVAAPAT